MHSVAAAGDRVTDYSRGFLPVAAVGLSSHLVLLRRRVSQQAWGKGRALLEALGLSAAQIAKCYGMHLPNEEEAVQHGLLVWMEGGTNTTWEALLKAMETAEIDVQQREGLKEKLRSSTGDSTGLMVYHVCMCMRAHVCELVSVCVCPFLFVGMHTALSDSVLSPLHFT